MASIVIVCSSCSKQLTVPPEVMGKKVKCPLCHDIFTAPAPAGEARGPRSLDEQERVSSQPILPPPRATSWAEPDTAPVRRPRYEDDDDYRRRDWDRDPSWRGRYDDDDDDFERRRWQRRGRSDLEEAESAVVAPGICLMVLGGLYVMIGMIFLLIAVNSGGDREFRIIMLVLTILAVCWGGFIVLGGIMMKSMRSYGLAMAASIMSLINYPFFVLHIILGIWSLVVLSRVEVRRAFRWKTQQQ